ncbi:MAG: major facilitator superfamily protein [Candidatus Dadabacteria bacterium CSP1-2]|nr:MAG: major facilitator superfamily protein [Candidatus Dadabacteria bacterium CSP1-2]
MDNSKKIFYVLFIASIVTNIGSGMIASLLGMYSKTLGATGLQLGIIYSGISFSRAILSPPIGKLSDEKGRKAFLIFGLLAYTLISFGYIYAKTAWGLIIVGLLHGAAAAFVLPIAFAYIGDITPIGKEGEYLGTFGISLFIGWAIGPILGGVIADVLGYKEAFLGMGILSFASLVITFFMLPESENIKKDGNSISYKSILKDRLLVVVLSVRFLHLITISSIVTFVPIFALSINLSLSQIGTILMLNILVMGLLQQPFGKLADRANRINMLIIGGIIASAGLMGIPFSTNFLQLLFWNMVMAIGSALSFPTTNAIMTVKGRTTGMASVMAVFNFAMSAGMALGPLIAGVIYDEMGLSWVFVVLSVISTLGLLLVYPFMRKTPDLSF